MIASVRSGRPFRALAGLALLLCIWLWWRLPAMRAALAAAGAALLPLVPAPPVPSPQPPPLQPPPPVVPPPRLRPTTAVPAPLPAPRLPAPVPPLAPTAEVAAPPATAAPSPAGAVAAPSPPHPDPAFALAETAYARLRSGDRRAAAALFDAALRLAPGNRQWRADRDALGLRWHADGFALLRGAGAAGASLASAASPVLGGGQAGGSLAWTPDPLARRPLAVVARFNIAADVAGVQRETAQAALGLRQQIVPGVSVSAESLFALGSAASNGWTLRLAAGGVHGRITAYGEAGLLARGQAYGGAQAELRAVRLGPARIAAGAWGSVQTGAPDVWRVDVGPSASLRWQGVRLQADWRQRVAGNAAPGSGPVVTVAAGF